MWINLPWVQARLKTGLALKMAEEEIDSNKFRSKIAVEVERAINSLKNRHTNRKTENVLAVRADSPDLQGADSPDLQGADNKEVEIA
jgi:hypothetical protein